MRAALKKKKRQNAGGSDLVRHEELMLEKTESRATRATSFFFFSFLVFCPFRATSMSCGGSQARALIRAAAAGLHHSHSNEGSEPHLQPTPKLTATLDP